MPPQRDAAQTLRQLIAGGRWRPGDRLPAERDIATALQIARSVTREALRELAAQGIVEARRGSGTYVAQVDALELAEVRLAFEPLAARLAAERHTLAHAKRLKTLLTRLRAAIDDPAAFAALDLDLHAEIARASGNSVLERVHDQLSVLLTLSRGVTVVDQGRLSRSLEQHEELEAAILARDQRGAERAMRRHIQSVARSAQYQTSHSANPLALTITQEIS